MLQIFGGLGLLLQRIVRPSNLGVDWGISETISSLLLLDIFDISPSEPGFTQSLASFVVEDIPSCQDETTLFWVSQGFKERERV